MNAFLIVILAALVGRFLLDLTADFLNLRHVEETLPAEFRDVYDDARYARSQRYLKEQTRFGILHDAITTAAVIAFMLLGGFNAIDGFVRGLFDGPIPRGIGFAALVFLAGQVLALPFSIYETFCIEARYGFNRTTAATFARDRAKGLLLATGIGLPVFALVLWFYLAAGAAAWLYAWGFITAFQLVMLFLAPTLIMPLFNKFEPLPDGALKEAVETYAREQQFAMKGVYRMDGSKRSSKTNAFFTGFGNARRVVLFDTLLANHGADEIVAIVAHEVGHYKLRHIPRAILRSIVVTGVTLWLLGAFIGNEALYAAFRMEQTPIYAGFIFFGLLYTPIGVVLSLIENAISRRHEFEADAFAARTTRAPAALARALKTLSAHNLGNLTPHPFKVWLRYSHPPVLARIRALE